ncbi:hypothetical protein LR48_Vigan197s002000 [Vigna angularis]|uniref:Uncharacterized protein n=1 Tax=Phaseolus angularis TaxID=3914 RepID=A0A0L9T681_PHAAN|nr:hypothetical protein LR48_Vigan197s002000 [Vigna angularis]
MSTSSSRLGKRSSSSRREANPCGWFSDDDQRTDFICQWSYKEVIKHKCMSILFFRNEGFLFQKWLEKAGLTKFVELQGDCYPNLVKVFYSNLKKEGNCLTSRVKGVNINIDPLIWKYVAGFQEGGMKAHLGIPGFYKTEIYNNFLNNPDMVGKYEIFGIENLSKEESLCAYMITWILLPRDEDQSLLNGEDIYLLYALPTGIPTKWSFVISDYMLKIAKQKEYHLPYGVFINSVGFRKVKEGWIFKDEYIPSIEEMNPLNIDSSKYKFMPETRFEEFVDERFKRLDEKMVMLQRSFSELHRKMDYALRINAFGDTSIDDSESGKNNADKKIVEKVKEGWIFKDEYIPSTEEMNPLNIDSSKYKFMPKTRFEEFVDERFKRLDEKMVMLQRSFSELHRKMDYALRINAFGDTSIDDSESGKNNADKKIVESSET